MGDNQAIVAREKYIGAPPEVFIATDGGCHILCQPQWLCMEDDASGIPALALGLLLFCQVAQAGDLGANQPSIAGSGQSPTR